MDIIGAILIGIVVLFCMIYLTIEDGEPDVIRLIFLILVMIAVFFVTWKLKDKIDQSEIPAIEVYRGRTDLVVNGEWRDSTFIPTDSTVVYKPEFKHKEND